MRRINRVFFIIIGILCFMVLFIDSDSLNSLFIHYDDVAVSEVSYVNHYSKVIYSDAALASQATPKQVTNENRWVWPTDSNYTITTYYSAGHRAIDIYYGYGANIYAANSGTVSMVKGGCVPGNLSCNGAGGNYVVIDHHNGYYTVYMHLKNILVSNGTNVTSGQVIGTMGNTGNVVPAPTSSAPYLGTHLHFCLYRGEPFKGGVAINPMSKY